MKKTIIAAIATSMCLSACSAPPADIAEIPSGTEAPPEATAEPTPKCTVNPAEYDSLNSTGVGWGLVRKKGAPPEVDLKGKTLLEEHGGYYMDQTMPKALYLTFDEGYENGFTAKILDILQAEQVPAAFFVTGPYLKNQTELVQRMIDEGHIVGNHTVNHLNLPQQTAETVQKELENLNRECEKIYGVSMNYMRPPEGEYSEKVLKVAEDMGYKTIMWSFAYKDWDINTQKGGDYAFSQVTPYLHDGAILLLHAVSSDNASALERIIEYAREQGYEFRSLDDLGK